MKRIRKRFLFILLALTMLGTIAYHYINNIFIPVKFKAYVIEHSEKFFDRHIEIEDMHFEFIKGFTLTDVRIYQKEHPGKLFFSANEISLNILLLAYIKDHNLIIPTIRVKNPSLFLKYKNYESWNYSDLLNKRKISQSSSIPPVLLRRIIIEKGDLTLSNVKGTNESTVLFENINLEAILSIDRTVNFEFSATTPIEASQLNAQGQYDFVNKRIISKISLRNLYLEQYSPFIKKLNNFAINQTNLFTSDLNLVLDKNALILKGDVAFKGLDYLFAKPGFDTSSNVSPKNTISFSGDLQAKNFDIKWDYSTLELTGNIESSSALLKIGDKRSFEGALSSNITQAIFNKEIFSVKGDINVHQTDFIIDEEKNLKGHLQATEFSFTKKNDIYIINGDYKINHALIKTNGINYLKGDLTFLNTKVSNQNQTWNLTGTIESDDTEISIDTDKKFTGNILAEKASITFSDNNFTLKTPLTLTEADFVLNNSSKIHGNLSSKETYLAFKDNILTLNTALITENTQILFEDKTFKGVPSLELALTRDSLTKSLDYTGTLQLTDAQIDGLPSIESVKNLKGNILFKPDFAETKKLLLEARGTKFDLAGNIKDFRSPFVDIDVNTENITFSTIRPYIEEYLEKYKFNIDGSSTLALHYKGLISEPKDAEITIRSVLKDSKLSTDKLPKEITHINGELNYKADHISWNNLTGQYDDKAYKLTGNIDNFSRPMAFTTVNSDDLNFKTQIKILRRVFEFMSLEGTYLNSDFNITGIVDLRTEPKTTLDLKGELKVNLKDVDALPEEIKTKISPFKPAGTIDIKGLYRGQFELWRDWQLTFEARSPGVILNHHTFKNFSLDYAQRDRHISQFDLSSDIYNGKLEISTTSDLLKETIPTTGTASLTNLDLAEYRRNNKTKNVYLSGNLSTALQFEGPLLNSKQIIGQGRAVITNGYLGRLIKEFKDAEFTDFDADFVIRNRRILTDNAKIYSKTIDLRAQGWVDFDQNINFDIIPDFGEAGIIKADNIRIDAASLLSNAISMKITGTISKPVKQVNKSPTKIFGNTTEIIREGIGSILQEVLP